jgi:hypothetical protein
MTQTTAAVLAAVPGIAVVRLVPVYTEDGAGPRRRTHVSLWDGTGELLAATPEVHALALYALRDAFPGAAVLRLPHEYHVSTGRLVPALLLRLPPELDVPIAPAPAPTDETDQ